ncbi:MAG TPA: aspartate-semialdehyde dehydrogenase [Polyangiaceae bacterium]|nr:aspartate-semialdehyde dehydrogenase [Polyangiaceae bacterium]
MARASTHELRVGVLGATGMVGQRFVSLLDQHPWFRVTAVAASAKSAGQPYREAMSGRWTLGTELPARIGDLVVRDASDVAAIAPEVDFVFCAVDMTKEQTRALEEAYARHETPVVSNNSAHRATPDVPMIVPEVNPEHAELVVAQRRRLGTKRGFIAVKPNCSIQSYVPAIHPLFDLGPSRLAVATYQALSGAGKTLSSWPEMVDNVIPFIQGEEDKSEQEPLKIWGRLDADHVVAARAPVISAQCFRVPVSDGHMAAVSVSFERKASREEIIGRWREFAGKPQQLRLPSAPKPALVYHDDDARPQTKLDRDAGRGMAISIGRLRSDAMFDYRFVALSHNTVRGAAGGAILTAELLVADGYIQPK